MRRPDRPLPFPSSWPATPAGGLAVLMALVLAGCASPTGPARTGAGGASSASPASPAAAAEQQRRSEFDQSLDAWHGATVQELVRKLGKPEAIHLGREGTLEYQYSKAGRPSADKRPFSCTVRYVVEGGTQKVIGHAIQGC